MTVSYLPREQWGADIAGIGRALSQILYPQQDIQTAVKQLLATNPAAIGQIAAAFRENPQALQGLLGGDISRAVLATPTSPAEMMRGIDLEALGGMTPEEREAFVGFRRAQAVGTTPTGMAREPREAEALRGLPQEAYEAGARREITGMTPGQESADAFAGTIYGYANQYLSQIPMDDVAKAAARSRLPELFHAEDMEALYEQQVKLQLLRNESDTDNWIRNFYLTQGGMLTRGTGFGDPAGWAKFLAGEEAPEGYERAFNTISTEDKIARVSTVAGMIRAAEDQIQQALGDDRLESATFQTAAINSQLELLRVYGVDLPEGLRATVEKEKGRFRVPVLEMLVKDKHALHYTDDKGNIYMPEDIAAMTMSSASKVTGPTPPEEEEGEALSAEATSILQNLQGVPPENMGAAVDIIRTQYPQVYAELVSRGIIQQ